jgi:N-acetylneuraminic acid mutarotase
LGFQGDSFLDCYDIDECKDPVLNTCNGGLKAYGFNSDTFGGEHVKFFLVQKSPDLHSLLIRFEVASPAGALMWLCSSQSNSSCYQLLIGGNGNTQFSLLKNNVTHSLVNNGVTSNLALNMSSFKSFWINLTLQYPASLLISAGSANDPPSVNFTDSSDIISVGYIGLSTFVSGQTTFWRNVRVGSNLQACLNNFGGYICVDIDDDEYLGIGTGGTMGSTYLGRPVVVSRDMISCSSHTLGGLSSIVSHGMAALDNWLFVCGGQSTFSTASGAACMKIDMNNSSAAWISSSSLPGPRQDFGMVSFNEYIFAIGGRDYQPNWGNSFSKSTVHKFSLASNVWEAQTTLPKPVYGHCVVSDEPNGLIWSIGGTISNASPFTSGVISDVFIYDINTNTWSLHSQLNFTTTSAACGMVTLKSGWKWLVVVLGDASPITVQYWSFYSNIMWRAYSNSLLDNQVSMRIVSLTPYSLIALGGETLRYGRNQRNMFYFNMDNRYFESGYNYLYSEMAMSAWVRVKRSYRSLANCISVVKYAAVGWGGATSSTPPVYTTSWDVLLRSRSTSMMWEPNSPVRCDNVIPDLSPGKITIGITSVGYWLLVCGGYQYLREEEKTCNFLDTNQVNPTWETMEAMPRARGDFPFVTYGDAAFAIGGYASGIYLNQMDRWTRTKGWLTVAPYPAAGLRMHCGVADEGFDKIYSLGGIRCDSYNYCTSLNEAYQYTVSTNTWSTFPDSTLTYAASAIACAITRRSYNGKRILLLTGNGVNYLQYFDLVTGTTWSKLTSLLYSWTRPRMVAVNPWEIYLTGGYCSSCPNSYG